MIVVSVIIYAMKRNLLYSLVISLFVLSACSKPTATPAPTQPPVTPTAEASPTPTQLPLALRVNGEGILITEYEAELARLQMAVEETGKQMTAEEQRQMVLDNLTDELLLAQAAQQAGFSVSDEELQARIDKLVSEIGGADKLTEWQAKYLFTEESFITYLKRSVLVAWQRDQITDAVPLTADQVHARQLIYQDEADANAALAALQGGTAFTQLAEAQDPVLGGELGWFPQGTLTQPVVEEALFALQPGEFTAVIKSEIGYHIVQMLEREPDHPLSVEARRMLQEKALDQWLTEKRAVSTIEVLVP